MLAKFFKTAIIFAAALTFFGGTAMADNWGRDGHHSQQGHHHYANHHPAQYTHHHPAYRPHFSGHVIPPRPYYRPHQQPTSSLSSLAPRIVFLGPLPVPVPPSPNEVLRFLAGH